MSGLSDLLGGGSSDGSGDSSNDPTQGGGVPWSQVLLAGVSGAIDSQLTHNYTVANPAYNTAGGVGGQAQGGTIAASASPMIWIALAVAAVVLVVVLVKK
jgi:hypothetical protein